MVLLEHLLKKYAWCQDYDILDPTISVMENS